MSKTYSDETKKAAVAALNGGLSVTKTAVRFGIPRSTIANWSSERKHPRRRVIRQKAKEQSKPEQRVSTAGQAFVFIPAAFPVPEPWVWGE